MNVFPRDFFSGSRCKLRIEDWGAVGMAYSGPVSAVVIVVVMVRLGLNSDELEVVELGLLSILLSNALRLV